MLNRFSDVIAPLPTNTVAFEEHWAESASRYCTHQHSKACKTGPFGCAGCRMAFLRGIHPNTGPVQPISSADLRCIIMELTRPLVDTTSSSFQSIDEAEEILHIKEFFAKMTDESVRKL